MDIRQPSLWSLAEEFTFLFVTLGPLNVIAPFADLTKGRDSASKRRLAFKATLLAAIALLVAATVGAQTLRAWGISAAALFLAAGAILFLVSLQPVLAGYNSGGPRKPSVAPSESELAFSPLAFPMIVSPYGLALLILLITLHPLDSGGLQILLVAAFVLGLDLVAMLCSDLIAKVPFVRTGLDILGCAMSVLLVALGVQVVAGALHLQLPNL